MSAPLADDVQTSPGAGLRCKGTKKNVYVQKKKYFLLSSCVYSKKIVTLQTISLDLSVYSQIINILTNKI